MYNGSPESQRKESDAGEEEPAAANAEEQKALRQREVRDGPPPGWRKSGETVVKGAGVELETQADAALIENYGGDPERDIHKKIVLSET